jgi:dolichyl-diphosphooligosaccharide---protein glycosyltransferase
MTSLVLSIIFAIAVSIRAYSARYGFFINEFDPYYDYYAASHIVNLAEHHGLFYALFNNPAGCGSMVLTSCHNQQGYYYWHDIQTWFPYGRNVAATSQGALQIGGAVIYLLVHDVFGVPITLYDLLVLLPVFFGAVSSILFYFLVRRLAGDAAGMFAALMFAVSPPLIERGNLGWYKSEPLAILFFLGASILMLSVFDKERSLRGRIFRGLSAGVLVGLSNASWGGGDLFSAGFGLVFAALPFLNIELSDFSPAVVSFTAATVFVSSAFPKASAIATNPVGLALVGGTAFVLVGQWAKTWSRPSEYKRTMLKFLFAFALGGLTIASFGLIGSVSGRYLSVIAPWTRSGSPLIESVAEHAVPTGGDYFTSYALLLSFGMAGALIAFRRRSVPMLFALVFGLAGLYFSAAFSRLLVYSSISLGLLAGIGFAELAFAIAKPGATPLVKKKAALTSTSRNEMKVVFSVAVIAMIVLPAGTYWIPNPIQCSSGTSFFCDQSPADSAVSIANGATSFSRATFTDWVQTLQWVRDSTPTNAVVISWWDYGYWIAVMGNRTTTADNATLNGTRIAEIGRMFMSNATQANTIAHKLGGDRPTYVALFLTGSLLTVQNSSGKSQQYYTLQVPGGGWFTAGGGDESKKQWFIRIGNLTESKYLDCPNLHSIDPSGVQCQNLDDFNLTPYALSSSLFGQLLPFQFSTYLVPQVSGNQIQLVSSSSYQFGYNQLPPLEAFGHPAVFTYPTSSTSLFKLAYASPSLTNLWQCGSSIQCFDVVLLYQVL